MFYHLEFLRCLFYYLQSSFGSLLVMYQSDFESLVIELNAGFLDNGTCDAIENFILF